ncbi:MAG TPA: hypothetical protein VGV37_07655 [Aliidongia sp.]|uniref:hypothetical protein n=1 Tax=Aliidongia sp. TaxID=1914230 RepID=UPI002DDCAC90|nr:hypothetical protein [Aliidongia sp.]HEV2674401.1 hypothetical protein [Aliidongia sp.]
MAEIIPMQGPCGACVSPDRVSFAGWLQQWFMRLQPRRQPVGNADELPDRMRRDMGLTPRAAEPGRLYHDYLSSRWP